MHREIKGVIKTIENGVAQLHLIEPLVARRCMLALLLLKYVSDQVEDGRPFFIPPHSKFGVLFQRRDVAYLDELVNVAFREFAVANKEHLDGVFDTVDFGTPPGYRPEVWMKCLHAVLEVFHSLDLTIPWQNLMNEIYEQLVPSSTEKNTDSYFTPPEVANLITRLLKPKSGDTICDPACGTGNLLLSTGKFLQEKGVRDFRLFGQEISEDHWMIAKMNLFLNRLPGRLEKEDTLWHPQLVDAKGNLLKFDVIVANPPFSLKRWGADLAQSDRYNRFHRGVPRADRLEMAFVSHMVETMNPQTGRIGMILPFGSLTRKGSEQKIRKALIQENLLDAVIGLPDNIFKSPFFVAIVILKKKRPDESVLFIDASAEFKPGKRNILTEGGVNRIVSAYQSRMTDGEFSQLVPRSEIEDAALNPNFFCGCRDE